MSRSLLKGLFAGICLLPALALAAPKDTQTVRQTFQDTVHTAIANAASGHTPQIRYRNGPIMLGTNTLYIIYYGNFNNTGSSTDTTAIINDFFGSVGGSGNYNVNTTYYDKNNNHITNSLAFDPVNNVYYDNYSIGTSVTSSGITQIVKNALTGGHLPVSSTAIYFVITSPDASTKMTGFCAYHTSSTSIISGTTIIYSALPDFDGSALQSCSGNVQDYGEQNSPNNNLGADNVLDDFMHELSEAVTDPTGKGWLTLTGSENGDLCNFNYGTTYIAPNGTHANTHLGSRDYLVQTIWENSGAGFCANTLP